MVDPVPFDPTTDTEADGPEEMCEFLCQDEIVVARSWPGPHAEGKVIAETEGGRMFRYDRTRDTGVHVYVCETC